MSLRLPASERKEQILDVALTVFASKGYHDASMNDIAKLADAVRRVVDNATESIAPLIAIDLDQSHLRTLAQAVVGASEGVARNLTKTDASFDPNVVGRQVADLLWAGLRGVGSV